MIGGAHAVPTDAEEIQNDALNREEALCLSRRLETSHLPFPLSSRLMGKIRPVVGVLPRVVDDRWHH